MLQTKGSFVTKPTNPATQIGLADQAPDHPSLAALGGRSIRSKKKLQEFWQNFPNFETFKLKLSSPTLLRRILVEKFEESP